MTTFSHSGDAGDIIYSLPVVRFFGGGDLFLSPADFTRVKMTPERVKMFSRLLESQEYIRTVKFHNGREVEFNLDEFRARFNDYAQCETLVQMHCRKWDVPEHVLDIPWIEVVPVKEAEVVVNLTTRWRNVDFPWKQVYSKYKDVMAFVGSQEEHAQFETHYGLVRHSKTKDLYDVASIIAGSKLFIGNQSMPLAIAHAMQHPTVCEYSRFAIDGMHRKIKCVGTAGKNVELPNL
jgi:hypothetical protein